MGAMLSQGTFAPPVRFGQLLVQPEGSQVGRNLAPIMFMSAQDRADEWFESEKVKLHLLKYAMEQMSFFDATGSAPALFFGVPMHHGYGSGPPRGGSGGLSDALVKAVESFGGEVRLNAEVVGVTVSGGKATSVTLATGDTFTARRAVGSNVDPRPLFNSLVSADATDPEFRRKVNKDGPFSGAKPRWLSPHRWAIRFVGALGAILVVFGVGALPAGLAVRLAVIVVGLVTVALAAFAAALPTANRIRAVNERGGTLVEIWTLGTIGPDIIRAMPSMLFRVRRESLAAPRDVIASTGR